MSDFKLPDLPSDDELGITDEDREAFAKEFGDESPEMTDEEMRALLGDVARTPAPGEAAAKPSRKAMRAAKKAEKERKKAEKRKAKEAKKAEAGALRTEASEPSRESEADQAVRIAKAAAATAAAGGGRKSPEDGPGAAGGPPRTPKPSRPEGALPKSRWRGPLTLTFLLLTAWVASSRTLLPRPAPANAPDTAFSSARAMSTLIEVAARPHPTGSPDHERVRTLLVERLVSLGLEPQVQTAPSMFRFGRDVRTATVRNIVARIPGTDPTGAVLLTAHYDGREISMAASDDGVGVATVVETVRALQVDGGLRNDIIVLLTDGEELGLLGARAFVDGHPWLADVSVVLAVEMRGAAGPSIMFETNELNGRVVRALKEFDPHPFATSLAYEVYRRMPNDTDFTPFKEAGKQGLNFASIDNAHVYHQAYDAPQALDESTLQHHGIRVLSAARYFGQADLTEVNGDNVVYFSVPLLGLVVYDASLVMVVSLLVLLALGGAFFAARRGGARPLAMLAGLGVTVLAGALTFAAAFALVGWLPRFHPEAGSLLGSMYHREGWYMVGLAGIGFTVLTTLYPIARRWLTAPEMGVGVAVVPAILALVAGFVAPLAAMTFQWPVIATLVSVATLALLSHRAHGAVAWVTTLLLTVPVIFLLEPLTELVWLALTFRLGAWLAVLAFLPLILCLPALESLRQPNSWWAPLLGLAVSAGSVGLGIVAARPSDTRPAPSTLVYAYEHGTGSAVWATDGSADSLDAAALAWAQQRVGGTFDGIRDLSRFAYVPGEAPVIAAPVASAQPPEVVLQRDTIVGNTRYVTLSVRSRIGAEYLAFAYDDAGSTRVTSINGQAVAEPGDVRWIDHWGVPDPAVVLELEMPAEEPIGLHVVEHLLRPEEILGPSAFERPPELAPDITRQSDRAMFRYSVGAFVDPRHAISLPVGVISAPGARPDSTGAAPSDSAGVPPDSSGAVPDTSGAVADTTGAVADTSAVAGTTGAVADTSAVADTTGAVPDTSAVADTTGAVPDTSAVADTTGAVPDTSRTLPETSAAAPDTSAAPGTGSVPPDTGAAADTSSARSGAVAVPGHFLRGVVPTVVGTLP